MLLSFLRGARLKKIDPFPRINNTGILPSDEMTFNQYQTVWRYKRFGFDGELHTMKTLLFFIHFLLFTVLCHGQNTYERVISDDCRLIVPEMVFREKPIEWTLVVTNKTSSFLHLSIGTSATGKTYNGEVGSQIYNNLTTNLLAPGEQNALTYKVERWFPADKKVGDHVEILAVIRNVETGEWKFGQAGSDFVQPKKSSWSLIRAA